jgi:hypothetical protein
MIDISQKIRENLNQYFVVNIPVDDVSPEGRNMISKKLSVAHHSDFVPNYTFDWRITSDNGTSLAKRISSYMYKKSSGHCRLSNAEKEYIGNIANQTKFYKDIFMFDFTDQIDWKLGDFGDGDSCFWISKSFMRTACNKSNRIYSIRIYDEFGKLGWGRALLILDFPFRKTVTAFNAYPKGFQVTNITRLIAKWINAHWGIDTTTRKISLRYANTWKKSLWINGGNASIVHPVNYEMKQPMITMRKFDLTDRSLNYVDLYKCHNCDENRKEHMAEVTLGDERVHLCHKCQMTHYFHCEICSTFSPKSSIVLIDGVNACPECRALVKICLCGRSFMPISNETEYQLNISDIDIEYAEYLRDINGGRMMLPHFGEMCGSCLHKLIDSISGPLMSIDYLTQVFSSARRCCQIAQNYVSNISQNWTIPPTRNVAVDLNYFFDEAEAVHIANIDEEEGEEEE